MKRPTLLLILVILASIFLFFLLNLLLGSVHIPFRSVWNILWGNTDESIIWQNIIWKSRVPQALTALVAGAGLSVSGLQMQTVFRNPLAGPSVLGISSGASLGVACVVLLSGAMGGVALSKLGYMGEVALSIAAIIGALSVMALIVYVSQKVKGNVTLLIIGVMIGYVASAIIGVLKYFSVEEDIRAYVIWGLGSFARVSGDQMILFVCIMAVLLPLSFLLIKTMNLLLLGDGYARNLGLNIKRARLLVISCSGVLVAIVTAYCGPIMFIGLAVPHLCRAIFHTSDHRILMPATLLVGASLALVCNLIARMPGFEGALPVNSVTALVGAPVVASVLFRKRKGELEEYLRIENKEVLKQETIHIEKLSIGYPGKGDVKVVASDICAGINSGELTCLLGANGVGKSTLLRTLSAFQPKLSGEIRIQGKEIGSYTDKQLSKVISVVLTEKCDIRNMTSVELIGLGRSPYTGFWGTLSKEDKEVVDHAINLVGISHLAHRMVHTLSDGERQKVMIAKALSQETPVIFLDEPTAFLDFPSKVEMMQLLHQLSRQTDKTIFLSTHDLELALQIADKIWLMDKANGVTIGTPEDLSLDGTLSSFFARKGIVFDLETGLFRVNNEYTSQIRIVGHGQKYAMVRKALQRNGILANRNVESDVYIETGDLKGDGTFVLHPVNGEAVTVQTIDELLAEIVKIL